MANRYSSRVEQARYNLDQLEANKPGDYESQYKNQIDGVQNKLNDMNKNGFSYDYTKDMAYQQYKNRYTRGAELASEDATAQAAARSGRHWQALTTRCPACAARRWPNTRTSRTAC